LLVQRDSRSGLDLFQSVLTTIDPEVDFKVLVMPVEKGEESADVQHLIGDQARQVDRRIAIEKLDGNPGPEIIRKAREGGFDLIIVPLPDEMDRGKTLALPEWIQHVLQNSPSRVLLVADPVLPTDLAE
jgi:nucleotide-binding universal stress UspA family protein